MKTLIIMSTIFGVLSFTYVTLSFGEDGVCNGVSDAMSQHLLAPSTKIDCKEALRYEKHGAVALPSVTTLEYVKKAYKTYKDVKGLL